MNIIHETVPPLLLLGINQIIARTPSSDMPEASLGSNPNDPNTVTMDPRREIPANEEHRVITKKDVVVKSEILKTETEQMPETCENDKDIIIKRESLEDDVVQQRLPSEVESAGGYREHPSDSKGSAVDGHQNRVDDGSRVERAYSSSSLSDPAVPGTTELFHQTNPFEQQSTDFSRLAIHQQQFSGIQHPAYRTTVPLANSRPPGFPHFYAPPTPPVSRQPVAPASFPTGSPSLPARHFPVGKRSRDEKNSSGLSDPTVAYSHNAAGMLNEAFLRDYQNELSNFHHRKSATNFTIPTGYSTAGTFRPSVARAYAHHHQHQHQNNNSVYRNQQPQYFSASNSTALRQNNKNKWNSNSGIGRTIHPPPHGPSPNSVSFKIVNLCSFAFRYLPSSLHSSVYTNAIENLKIDHFILCNGICNGLLAQYGIGQNASQLYSLAIVLFSIPRVTLRFACHELTF